jgi:hypothetical protein
MLWNMSTLYRNGRLPGKGWPKDIGIDFNKAKSRAVLETSNRPKSLKWVLILSVMTAFWSCNKEDELFIDPALQEYFDRFMVEGASRNVTVDYVKSRISGYMRLIGEPGVIGQCAHSESEPNKVFIDQLYWNTATDLEREFVVFHELGHCVLNREHLDDSDNQGNCVSIMTSGTGSCHINYTVSTRKGLLDELFQ